jgi:hypothetical protein
MRWKQALSYAVRVAEATVTYSMLVLSFRIDKAVAFRIGLC